MNTDIRYLENKLLTLNNSLTEYQSQRSKLYEEYKNINLMQFEVDSSCLVCPTCKRIFEGEDYDSKLQEMQDTFQTNKSTRLNDNIKKGTALKTKIEDLQKQVQDIEQAIKEKKESVIYFGSRETAVAEFRAENSRCYGSCRTE